MNYILKNDFIKRNYKHVINGQEVLLPKGRPTLSPDAVTTIFPNLPSYFTKKLPKKRKERDPSVSSLITKRRCVENYAVSHSSNNSLDRNNLSGNLPSKYWLPINFEVAPNVSVFAVMTNYTGFFKNPSKHIVLDWN